MSREKQTSDSTRTVEATPEERELNRLLLERTRAGQEGAIQTQESGFNLINQLLTGGDLPGNLSGLASGISQDAIAAQATELGAKSSAGFQNLGILDSGVAFRETSEDIARNLLLPVEQFNIQNRQQLLNLAAGGQASNQAQIGQGTGQLSSNLQGLRSINSSTTNTFMNPFLKSFQQSAGKSLGSPKFSAGPFTFGG